MISYELALELKQAGYPQPLHGEDDALWLQDEDTREIVYAPSLSELIAACPKVREPFEFCLRFVSSENAWLAGYEWGMDWLGQKAEGLTPEEAVARLWLKLRKGEAISS